MSIRSIRDLLAEHPAFAGFDEEALSDVAGCARNVGFEAGETIFREGDDPDRVLILRRGDVALEISAPGREPLVVETRHAGQVLGWAWLAPGCRAMSDARAVTDVRAVSLDAACVRRKCDERPELGYRMFKLWLPQLAERVRAQRLQLLDLYGNDAR